MENEPLMSSDLPGPHLTLVPQESAGSQADARRRERYYGLPTTPQTLKYVNFFAGLQVPFHDVPRSHNTDDNRASGAVPDALSKGKEGDVIFGPGLRYAGLQFVFI